MQSCVVACGLSRNTEILVNLSCIHIFASIECQKCLLSCVGIITTVKTIYSSLSIKPTGYIYLMAKSKPKLKIDTCLSWHVASPPIKRVFIFIFRMSAVWTRRKLPICELEHAVLERDQVLIIPGVTRTLPLLQADVYSRFALTSSYAAQDVPYIADKTWISIDQEGHISVHNLRSILFRAGYVVSDCKQSK